MWITWKHRDSDLARPISFNRKVELFQEQALGWQLHIADLVANGGTAFGEGGKRDGREVSSIRHSGFAVLQICLSYFETIGYYSSSPVGSEDAFRKGVVEVFTELGAVDLNLDELGAALYADARCGLYHNVRTSRVGLGFPPGDAAVMNLNGRAVVCPERLPKMLKAHLERFALKLLDEKNRNLRKTFEERFNRDAGIA
jgi:hypothetical protein